MLIVAIAEALDSRIFVQRDKKAILDCLDDLSLSSRLTRNDNEARVHVVSMSALSYQVTNKICLCWQSNDTFH